jgi:cytochrome P450
MFTLILSTFILTGIYWGLWCIFRQYLVRSSLDNIPGPPPTSFWKGNWDQLFNFDGWDFHDYLVNTYGGIVRLRSMFGARILYVFDPKALYHVVVKDQEIYEETAGYLESNKVLFGEGLSAVSGEQHCKQRKILNPVFNSAHMRELTPTFYEVGNRLKAAFERKVDQGPTEIDVTHWLSRAALEIIGTGGFGYSFDSLREGETPHPYCVSAKQLLPAVFSFFIHRTYTLPIAAKLFSLKVRRWIVDLLPSKRLHRIRDIVDSIHKVSLEIYESKKKALLEGDDVVTRQIGAGKDILSVLMRANLDAPEDGRLSEEELIAQMTLLTFVGVDSTSSGLSRILHLLALHPEVQHKLRQELKESRKRHISYDELVSLPYMDAIIRETLRLYPPGPLVQRMAKEDSILPLSTPVKALDGRELREIPVPSGTLVILSIIGSNRNAEIWGSDACEWKPERWLSPLPNSVTKAHIPGICSHLMTFLGGSRACIGFKFSQLEMKIILSLLVEAFEFKPSDKEIYWRMTNMASPTVKGGDGKTSLPLIVSLAKQRVA